jgi:hypothetical protein
MIQTDTEKEITRGHAFNAQFGKRMIQQQGTWRGCPSNRMSSLLSDLWIDHVSFLDCSLNLINPSASFCILLDAIYHLNMADRQMGSSLPIQPAHATVLHINLIWSAGRLWPAQIEIV